MTNTNISVKSLNLSLPLNLSCVITTNTDVNTNKLDNIVNVIWFQYNGTRNIIPLFSNNYRIHSTTSIGTTIFESKVEFVQVRASMAGLYQCRTWIGEDFYRNVRDHTNVTVKCKCKINYTFIIKWWYYFSIPQFLIIQHIPLLMIP